MSAARPARANGTSRAYLSLGHLMVPALSRPAEPTGDQAIRLARYRERQRMCSIPDPPWDIARDQIPPVMPGRGGSRHSRGGRPRVLDDAQDEVVAALYAQGWGALRIAKSLGCSRSAVLSSLGRTGTATYRGHARYGQSMTRERGMTVKQEVRVQEMLAGGRSPLAIARDLGVSIGKVRYVEKVGPR